MFAIFVGGTSTVSAALGSTNAELLSALITIAASEKRPTSISLSQFAISSGYRKEDLPALLDDCHRAMMHCFQLPLLKEFGVQNLERVRLSEAVVGLARMIPYFNYHEWRQPCGMPYDCPG